MFSPDGTLISASAAPHCGALPVKITCRVSKVFLILFFIIIFFIDINIDCLTTNFVLKLTISLIHFSFSFPLFSLIYPSFRAAWFYQPWIFSLAVKTYDLAGSFLRQYVTKPSHFDPKRTRDWKNAFYLDETGQSVHIFEKVSFSSYVQHKKEKNKQLIQLLLCQLDTDAK